MRWLARMSAAVVLAFSFGFAAPQLATAAFDPLDPSCESVSGAQSPTCTRDKSTNPLTGEDGVLFRVARVISIIAGVAAVIILIFAGISYITAGGDAQKITSAKNMIIGAIVGLIVIALAQVIITYIVKGALT